MDKHHIIAEIKRTAQENGGRPLGVARFHQATGIKESDWYGRYWVRWSDAVTEAGYPPNTLQRAFDEDRLLKSLVSLIRELGRFPLKGDLLLKRRRDPGFPSHNTFTRLGGKRQLAARVLQYCQMHSGFEDVASLCGELASRDQIDLPMAVRPKADDAGTVYLLKSGRYFKIGRTNAVGRREREMAIQLPEKARTVHVIRTDDPNGIEAYWHTRFAAKRKHGEWFELDNSDVIAFKRRKFM